MISNYNLISNTSSGSSFISASGDFVFRVPMCELLCVCVHAFAAMATAWSVDRHQSERSLASPSCFLCMRTLAISRIPSMCPLTLLSERPCSTQGPCYHLDHRPPCCLCDVCAVVACLFCPVLFLNEFGCFRSAQHVSCAPFGSARAALFVSCKYVYCQFLASDVRLTSEVRVTCVCVCVGCGCICVCVSKVMGQL